MNRDLVHKSASNQNRNKLDSTIRTYHKHTYKEAFKDLKTAFLNSLDELGFSLLKASFLLFSFNAKCFLPYEYCTNQAWETDRISRSPQTLNAELNEPGLAIPVDSSQLNNNFNQQLHHQQMNYKLHGPRGPRPDLRKDMNKGNTDAAHNAAYLGESTPPIETFIKLSSLTKLKKSLRARLEYTLYDKNEDGDEVIEDIREAAKPFHLRKASNTIVNVLAHIREDLRMAMAIDTKRTGEMGSLVSNGQRALERSIRHCQEPGIMEGPTASAGYLIIEGLTDTVAALSQYSQVLRVMGRSLEEFEGYEQPRYGHGRQRLEKRMKIGTFRGLVHNCNLPLWADLFFGL
ncbi:hypothetical protein PPACK8108_LOCUS11860 [Phakopsora pachyrhizi]|uniref:Uncharacterized protein n=1 Tax=Phakopsora pachyrhizi TaxID=170000 RepID=A0AAV0B0U9_PHAPC|nr:hypothetical protein PPACK8108_LOCUS11860 [Phakopsora pachyrhizi]